MSNAVRLSTVAACVGLGTVVVGTFLPWLRSGSVLRNSYAGDAALRRLVRQDGLQVVFTAWPFIGLAGAVAAALLIIGRRRPGAVLATLTAAAAGATAATALRADATSVVRAAAPGPVVTIAGAAVTLLALFLIVPRRTP